MPTVNVNLKTEMANAWTGGVWELADGKHTIKIISERPGGFKGGKVPALNTSKGAIAIGALFNASVMTSPAAQSMWSQDFTVLTFDPQVELVIEMANKRVVSIALATATAPAASPFG
jgi:hypothetical protein